VTCLDVIEHTPDDRRTLREPRRLCRPGGTLLVTVPAYQSLWSAHDGANQHYRRYTATGLRAAARETGWELVRDTYFDSVLLAPAAVVRLAQRARRGSTHRSDLSLTPPRLDRLLELPLRVEASASRAGARLPAGLSLLAVFRAVPSSAAAAPRSRPSPGTPTAAATRPGGRAVAA